MVLQDLKQSSSENKPRPPGRLESEHRHSATCKGWEQNQPGPNHAGPGAGEGAAGDRERPPLPSQEADRAALTWTLQVTDRNAERAGREGLRKPVGYRRPSAQKEQRLARGYTVPHGRVGSGDSRCWSLGP